MSPNVALMFDRPLPDNARGFYDPEKMRSWVIENAVDGFKSKLGNLENDRFKLKSTGIKAEIPNYTLQDHKKAVLERKDLTIPIRGGLQLIDKKTNKVVDEKKDMVLARIPYITNNGTVLLNGSEYVPATQLRLKPGVYTREKKSGQIETAINAANGIGGKIVFDPASETFFYMLGGTKYHLYSLLVGLGIQDSQIKNAWGDELHRKNRMKFDAATVDHLYAKLFTRPVV